MRDNQQPQPTPQGLGPPRFRLGTLLLIVAAICAVLAAYRGVGAYGASIVGLFVLAILAHVGGNWLGTQLRDLGSMPREHADDAALPTRHPKGPVESHHFAPTTHLHHRSALSRATLLMIVVGSGIGAAGGALLLWFVLGSTFTWTAFVFGTLAFGILGGIWMFALSAFVHSAWRAWSEAAGKVRSEE